MPGGDQFDSTGIQVSKGKKRSPKKERRNRRRPNAPPNKHDGEIYCLFNIKQPLTFKNGAYHKDPSVVQVRIKSYEDQLKDKSPSTGWAISAIV